MWGNALGWCISAVMVLATSGFITWLNHNMQSVSPRTEFSSRSDSAPAIEFPAPPITVVPTMTHQSDGGPIYRRAIDEYLKSPLVYERFARAGTLDDLYQVPAIKVLIEATNCETATLFADQPGKIVNFNNDKPELEALRTLGACARHAGMLIERSKTSPAEAMKLYEATFSLGVKMYQERLTYEQLESGLRMMAEASALIRGHATASGDTARADACKRFDDARVEYVKNKLQPTQRVIVSADPTVIEQHAGDVFYFARHAEDRMWRVEAILKLGRYRFHAGRIGDQSSAMLVIRELLNDPDPVIQAAATAARDLTIEQYRMLR
jgi:hypothetical protein